MTLADYASTAFAVLNGGLAAVHFHLGIRHDALRSRSSEHATEHVPQDLTPSVKYRDEMIRQGLFG